MLAFKLFVSSVDFFGTGLGHVPQLGSHIRDPVGVVLLDQGLVGFLNFFERGFRRQTQGFVGFSAMTMDGSLIKKNGMLAAGSLLSPGKTVAAGEMWMGRPAKFVRELGESEFRALSKGAAKYLRTATDYLEEYK